MPVVGWAQREQLTGGRNDGICSHKRELQGRGLSRQGPHPVSRLWFWMCGRQPFASSEMERRAGGNEEFRRDLLRSGRADGQRILALGRRKYSGLGKRTAARCRKPEERQAPGGSVADPDGFRRCRIWRTLSP